MEYLKYQHIERFGSSEVEGIELGTCYVFSKIDGCFPYGSSVMLEDGTTMDIGTIVNQKKSLSVMSYDFNLKRIVSKKITNWFKYPVDKNKIKDEWITIGVKRNGTQLISSANSRIKIRVTNNHMFFIKDIKNNIPIEVPAKDLKIGDIVYTPSQDLGSIQEQVLLGTLVGDGSMFPNKETSYNGIEFGHSIKQKEYVKHKLLLLGDLKNKYREVNNDSSYGKEKAHGSTIIDKRTQQVHDLCYKNGVKTITEKWLNKLNSLGLAIWYMDDVSKHNNIRSNVATFHVEGFSNYEQEIILNFFNKRGYEARIQKSGNYRIIKFGVKGSDNFYTDISQHVIESMQYKLPEKYRGRYTNLIDDFDVSLSIQEREIISIIKGIDGDFKTSFSNGLYKYDIEVDGTHSYFCNGIMVHNSNGSVWIDENGQIKAGSRNRELTLEKDNAGFYAEILKDERIKNLFTVLPNIRLYGEFLVPHTLKTYNKDAWKKFYVFDVMIRDKYIDYESYKTILDVYGIEYIPPICIINNPSYEQLINQLEKATYLIEDGKGAGEGIVIKNYDFVNKYGRITWAKIVTNEFKATKAKCEPNELKGAKMVEEEIALKYVTDVLVEKEYSKIVNDNNGWSSKNIPQLLNTVYHCIVKEELWDALKTFKNPTINFKTLQHFVTNRIKELKTELF